MPSPTRQFYIVQIGASRNSVALSARHLRAIVPLGGERFHIWLDGDVDIPERVGDRLTMLAGFTPLSKVGWEVSSTQLGEIFE